MSTQREWLADEIGRILLPRAKGQPIEYWGGVLDALLLLRAAPGPRCDGCPSEAGCHQCARRPAAAVPEAEDGRECWVEGLSPSGRIDCNCGETVDLGSYAGHVRAAARDDERARLALAELVRLKDIKERYSMSVDWEVIEPLALDYEENQPKAWAAARAVLAASPAVTEGERECPYPMCSCAMGATPTCRGFRRSASPAVTAAEDETRCDGFCPRCGALADEACHVDGRAVPDHKARHPYPAPAVTAVPAEEAE